MKLWKLICAMTLLFNAAAAPASPAVTVYKGPTCGCCGKYVSYLRQNGFSVKTIEQNDMDSV